MPLPEPTIDRRTYRELLNEALARIPVHNPEWKNFNDSDPGVTLLQLFAFMAESVIYRANQIPERNRRKFLKLLGIPLEPARPAHGLVTFGSTRLQALEVRETDELRAGNVPFRLTRGLLVLPVEGRLYYKKRVEEPRRAEIQSTYDRLYASIRQPSQALDFYETQPLAVPAAGAVLPPALALEDTVDRSVWLALLARRPDEREAVRAAIAQRTLTLGIVPALDAEGKVLYPAGPPTAAERPRLVFEVPDAASPTPRYRPIEPSYSEDVLSAPGVVDLPLPEAARLTTWEGLGPLQTGVGGYPPALENSEDLARLITWIRIRAPKLENEGAEGGQSRITLSWVGVNVAPVVQRTHVAAERLPDGTGEPDQHARLAHVPVVEDSVHLTVNGRRWSRVVDLSEAGPEAPPRMPRHAGLAGRAQEGTPESRVFTVDRESGEIRFGDGARGARPPRGAVILCSYDYGGGVQGLVGIGALSRPPERPELVGLTVTNPIPTWGGAEAERVADAERRIPAVLRHRNVLATKQDYEEIVRRTPGVAIGRVAVLVLTHPDRPDEPAPGVVTVLVIPEADPAQPGPPSPDRLFLETVCSYLEPRRMITTELHVRGPKYRPVAIGLGIQAVPGQPEGVVVEAVRRAVLEFLSPLRGGFDGTGWPLGKAVEPLEIQAAAARVSGVAKVTGLVLADMTGTELPSGLPLERLELPHVGAIRITPGAPPTLGELFGGPPPAEEPPALPVPVAPAEC